ncbi:MAG: hypothetical protein H6Q86_2168, partial [candidate division NC10 bacterium]|nr:hypothetical protein [candidate division NC10 bacterium]
MRHHNHHDSLHCPANPRSGITTIHYIVRHTLGAAKTREQLHKILGMFTVAPVTHAIIVDALELGFPDYEDAVLHE